MNKKIFFIYFAFLVLTPKLFGQQTILSAGGEGAGSGGSFSYSIGQIDYIAFSSTTGNVGLGVQHAGPKSIINLKLFLEGYYDLNTHTMVPVKLNQGIGSSTTYVDDITVELHNSTNRNLVATATTKLQNDGSAIATYTTALSGNYYIVVKQRNTIETWSATPQTMGTEPITYDFTDSDSKAYGSNQKMLETGVYGIYSGDVNQDGFVDAFDVVPVMNDIDLLLEGNLSTDINGDGFVDSFDLPMLFNNNDNLIEVLKPNANRRRR